MWNLFGRKRKSGPGGQSRAAGRPSDRVQELANTLQREGRAQELEGELTKLDLQTLSAGELESWWHLYGITAFQDGREAEALARFQEGYEKFPASALIRFSLGQQYIRTGAVEEGFALFRAGKFPEIPREYALAQARYAYLWNRCDDGFLFLRPFFDAYEKLRILDDHFLYVRGLPFFGQWWSYLAAFSILAGDVQELEKVTTFVTKHCHDYDFEYLNTELQAHRDDRPDLLLGRLEARLRTTEAGSFPTGYTRMNIAVIQARTAPTAEAARHVLSEVVLSPQDFPWLVDIRTLALAQVAGRFGDAALENGQVETFLARQPMLFEPDIALNFHLLRYQERLKPRVSLRKSEDSPPSSSPA
jgi:hypothetical protein